MQIRRRVSVCDAERNGDRDRERNRVRNSERQRKQVRECDAKKNGDRNRLRQGHSEQLTQRQMQKAEGQGCEIAPEAAASETKMESD